MKYFKQIIDGYIVGISKGGHGVEITESEYNEIMTIIRTHPQETETIGYRLKTDLTWESYEKEPQPEPEIDDIEAMSILLGGAS